MSLKETNPGILSGPNMATPLWEAARANALKSVKLLLEDPIRPRQEKMKWLSMTATNSSHLEALTALEVARETRSSKCAQYIEDFMKG